MLSTTRAPDAHRLLLRALLAALPDAALLASKATPWASVTFVGARHEVTLAFATPAQAEAAAARLPEMEFTLRRHLVADVAVTRETGQVDIAVLTVEEW